MAQKSLFGLDRERRIVASGIRDIFTPHQPINSVELFFGREREVERIIAALQTPGQHVALYGDRGVGKSSLANVASQVVLKHLFSGNSSMMRCDTHTTFETLALEIRRRVGIELEPVEETTTSREVGTFGLDAIAKANVQKESTRTEKRQLNPATSTPSAVAAAVAGREALVIVDEMDAIQKAQDRHKLAELMKLLSDSGSPLKMLVVGIAQTCADLLAGHPSVQRCLREVKLRRMTDPEIAQIVLAGCDKAKLSMPPDVLSKIVKLSSGYPHFAHLLALKCAERAVGDSRRDITADDLTHARKEALEDAEATLQKRYNDAVRSYSTEMYRHIVEAAAELDDDEFSAAALRLRLSTRLNRGVKQGELNNYLKRLVSDPSTAIMKRVGKGVYCFIDPRMKSFVRICES